jgi:hypothetical protein
MTTLEKYLTEDYPIDVADLADIDATAKSVAAIYEIGFERDLAWPYQLVNGAPVRASTSRNAEQGSLAAPETNSEDNDQLSQSTTAMIANSLLRFAGYFRGEDNRRRGFATRANLFPVDGSEEVFSPKKSRNLETIVIEALEDLLKSVSSRTDRLTKSSTYGNDDIFTVAWLAELSKADWTSLDASGALSSKWSELLPRLKDVVRKKADGWANPETRTALFTPKDNNTSAEHAFTVLRLAQTIRRLFDKDLTPSTQASQDDASEQPAPVSMPSAARDELVAESEAKASSEWLETCHRFFEVTLHQQLSFSAIPDSRFDPAELVFCLEGMLICKPSTVDRTVFDRVMLVLSSAQQESAYWRPVKPFLSTPQGLVLFPVSVEIANSLMRACAIFDADQIGDAYGSKCIPLLRRYWQWLRARAVQVQGVGGSAGETMGWHSEHVNDPTRVHLWETSQVMEFLLGYKNALHRHVARTTLVLARFTQEPISYEPWSKTVKNEPVKGLGDELEVYRRIGEEYVVPHMREDADKYYSMLLYGPPGTGKTTIAKGVANALRRRLLTITVSDFLAEGGAQVEARAKNIFTVLMAQHSCVVLFDEIDHFLLDRDSERYTKQDTVFQFMTPGMLTKLNDLRAQQRSLFIVATNYEDRIDAAIKRTGRIDEKFLVLPPAQEKRVEIIKQQIAKAKLVVTGDTGATLSDDDYQSLGRASLFLGFKDIQGTIVRTNSPNGTTLETLRKAFVKRSRTTSIEAYTSRFFAGTEPLPPRETPIGEFLGLIALYCEAHEDELSQGKTGMDKVQERAVKKAISVMRSDDAEGAAFNEDASRKLVEHHAPFLKNFDRVALLLRLV